MKLEGWGGGVGWDNAGRRKRTSRKGRASPSSHQQAGGGEAKRRGLALPASWPPPKTGGTCWHDADAADLRQVVGGHRPATHRQRVFAGMGRGWVVWGGVVRKRWGERDEASLAKAKMQKATQR